MKATPLGQSGMSWPPAVTRTRKEDAKQLRKGDERAATNDAGGGLLMGAFFWALAICVVVDNSARNDSKDGDQLKLV
jgi:hypothetical protein